MSQAQFERALRGLAAGEGGPEASRCLQRAAQDSLDALRVLEDVIGELKATAPSLRGRQADGAVYSLAGCLADLLDALGVETPEAPGGSL